MIKLSLLKINIEQQCLTGFKNSEACCFYPVSTATNGVGELKNSEKTPRGWHQIAAKIGDGCAINTVFVSRESTGEIYTPHWAQQFPERDWILTRILWLAGCEPGFNQGGEVDTQSRFIYLHGTPDEIELGVPGSHGCIRMRNADIVQLFDQVDTNTRVYI